MKKLPLLLLFTLFLPSPFASATPGEEQAFAVVEIITFDRYIDHLYELDNADFLASGSGVIINTAKDEIITNYHVIADYLEDPGSRTLLICLTYSYSESPVCKFRGSVEKYNESLDLALVKIETGYHSEEREFLEYPKYFDVEELPYTPISLHVKPEDTDPGDKVFILGFPAYGGANITLTTGAVSGFDTIMTRNEKYIWYIKTDAKLNPGNSGGAAFDENNLLIGILTAVAGGDGNIGYIIPIRTVRMFLHDRDGNIDVKYLEEAIEEAQADYEKWAAEQCGEHSALNDEGECSCVEGYEWEDKEDEENFDCVLAPEEEKDEAEKEAETLACPENSQLDESGACVCDEGFTSDGKDTEMKCLSIPIEDFSFSDVSARHRNRVAIEYLKEHEVLSGYPDGTFKPQNPVNRAELLKILVEASAEDFVPSARDTDCFTDVKKGEWFTPYVCYAKNKSWVNGYADGSFKPNQTVSKVEAIKIVLVAYGFFIPSSVDTLPFADVSAADWFAPYLLAALEKGILEETIGTYQPHSGMTRASVSESIYRALLELH